MSFEKKTSYPGSHRNKSANDNSDYGYKIERWLEKEKAEKIAKRRARASIQKYYLEPYKV